MTQISAPTLLIRRATVNDCADIAALCQGHEDLRQMAPQETSPLTAEVVAGWLHERNSGYVLENEEGRVVAYAELNTDRHLAGRYWIGHLAVAPDQRGRHLGRRLVSSLTTTALAQLDADEVWISAFADNPSALACYRAAGFRDVGQRPVMGRTLVDLARPQRPRLPLWVLVLSALAVGLMGLVWWSRR